MSHVLFFFFFNDTATTEIYTLSLHDALPIFGKPRNLTLVYAAGQGDGKQRGLNHFGHEGLVRRVIGGHWGDRKSTRLNSSHLVISYAVFCLKKKKKLETTAYATIINQVSTVY